MLVTSLIAVVTFWSPAPEGWTADYSSALEQARQQNKLVLANFTGSDWCTYCKDLKAEVFETKTFKDWAKENVILLELDFPHNIRLPHVIEDQNEVIGKRYAKIVEGFPTILLLKPDGHPYGKFGYEPGGPDVWTASIEVALNQYRNSAPKAPKA